MGCTSAIFEISFPTGKTIYFNSNSHSQPPSKSKQKDTSVLTPGTSIITDQQPPLIHTNKTTMVRHPILFPQNRETRLNLPSFFSYSSEASADHSTPTPDSCHKVSACTDPDWDLTDLMNIIVLIQWRLCRREILERN